MDVGAEKPLLECALEFRAALLDQFQHVHRFRSRWRGWCLGDRASRILLPCGEDLGGGGKALLDKDPDGLWRKVARADTAEILIKPSMDSHVNPRQG